MMTKEDAIRDAQQATGIAAGLVQGKPHVTAVEDFNRSLEVLAEAVHHLDALASELKGHDQTPPGGFEAPIGSISDIVELTPGMLREVGHRIDKIREGMVTTLKLA